MADNTKRFELSRQNSATAPPSTLPPGTSVTVIPAAARLLQKGTLLRILVFVPAFGCCSGFFWFGLRIIFRENDYELAGWLLCCGFAFAIIQPIVQEIVALLTFAKFGRLTELKPSKPAPLERRSAKSYQFNAERHRVRRVSSCSGNPPRQPQIETCVGGLAMALPCAVAASFSPSSKASAIL